METTWKLGEVIRQFRDRYRLSKSKAAEVLGVSILYVRSLEEGVDVKTGLTFKPRDATLLQLAAKMTEFGYPVTFEELKAAAGMIPGEEKAAGPKVEEPKPAPAIERPKFNLLDGGIDGRFEPTEDELKIIQQAEEEDVWFGILSQPGFWDDPPEDRRSTFRYLEGLIDEARRFKRRRSTK